MENMLRRLNLQGLVTTGDGGQNEAKSSIGSACVIRRRLKQPQNLKKKKEGT
jgi:hypothetical protein